MNKKLLNSNKVVIVALYTLLVVCMGISTILEKAYGTPWVHEQMYGSWWFVALWSLLSLFAIYYIYMTGMLKRMAVLLLHVSFLVILLGAFITHIWAKEGTLHLRQGEGVASYIDKEEKKEQLPFSMTLSEFNVIYYPGTDAIMDYEAHIETEHEGEKDSLTVSMNHIGKVAGWRFYQSSYDADLQGTTLLVAHDPYGIAITYTGYVMLLVGLLCTMFSRHTQIRRLYRIATKGAAVLFFLFISTGSLLAKPSATHIDRKVADEMGQVAVLYNGRICPLNTAATEFVTKLCGRSTWEDLSANEIFLSWMIFYSEWETQPIIQVKNREVQEILGIEGKWASVKDFYTTQHEYKLKDRLSDSNLSESQRKALRDVDEKIQVVTMFYNSEMLRIFPLKTDGRIGWYTPGSTEIPQGIGENEFQFINHAMDHLVKSILANDVHKAQEMIAKIKLYQRQKAGEVLPSAASLWAEVFYNSLLSKRWVVFLCLTLSLLFCCLIFWGKENSWTDHLQTIFHAHLGVFLTLLLGLRWYISGHIPLSNGYETMIFLAWAVLILSLLGARHVPILKTLGALVSTLCMLVSMIAMGSPQVTQLMPVLQSPLLTIHVAMVMLSYALFALITLIATRCLLLKDSVMQIRLTALSRLLLYPAVAMLTIGIFVGAVWANVSWGNYWSWDPKETWALITLMIYAIPLHQTSFTYLQPPRRYHIYVLTSFLAVIITYFGVNYFMTGMHSYA